MNQEQKMVREFHKKFGFTINNNPTLVENELGLVRHRHTMEETTEYLLGILKGDIVAIADALGDLLYFIYGTAVAYGIDMEPIFAEIHRSNMSKDRPDPMKYVDAKAVKGDRYSPPDLESIIRNSSLKETPK